MQKSELATEAVSSLKSQLSPSLDETILFLVRA